MQTFQLPVTTDEQTDSSFVPDSVMLDIPSAVEVSSLGESSPTPYSTFVFRQLGYAPTNPAITEYNTNFTLIKLFWSDSSFAVHETLFLGPDAKDEDQDKSAGQSHVLQLRKTPIHLRHLLGRKKGDEDDDGFIVDDWDESTVAPPRAGHRQALPSRNRDTLFDPQWTLDMKTIYELVVTNLLAGTNQSDSEPLRQRPTLSQMIQGVASNTLETLAEWNATETM